MKKRNSISISTRIFLTYFGLIVMFAVVAIFCYQTITSNRATSKYVSGVVDPSLKAMDDLELMVVKSKMLVTNWVFLRADADDKEALKILHTKEYPAIEKRIDVLTKNWDNKASADSLQAVLTSFEQLLRAQKMITLRLVDFEDYDDPSIKFEAESAIEEKIIPETNNLITRLHSVIDFQKAQKAVLEEKVAAATTNLRNFVSIILAVFIAVCIIMAIYMTNIITKPILKIREGIAELGVGKLNQIDDINRNDEISDMISSVNTLVQNLKQTTEFANSIGKGNFKVEHTPLSDDDVLGKALLNMKENLSKFTAEERDRNWLNQGINEVGELLRKDHDNPILLSKKVLAYVLEYINADQGAAYRVYPNKGKKVIELTATQGFSFTEKSNEIYAEGECVVGKCVDDKKMCMIPGANGAQRLIYPMMVEDEVKAVFEITTPAPFSYLTMQFLYRVGEMMAGTCDLIERKQTTELLLSEAQKLNAELSSKEEALILAHHKMEEKAHMLEEQNEAIRTKNESLEIAREALRVKAEELERANQYKSEFLANMSHELRTPLNSILILSNLLVENKTQNLNNKQVEYSKVIQKSGSDLLMLINDILDLSKIESKNMELDVEDLNIKEWASDIKLLFAEVAKNKGINFNVSLDRNIPLNLSTDRMRLSQVIKNLLSNAFKFTESKGVVSLRVGYADDAIPYNHIKIPGNALYFEVADTGIGIPAEKQQLIFEPFRQADGSTSRKFGGTGLGLSISRELSALLGGELTLTSEAGKGSTFRLILPITQAEENGAAPNSDQAQPAKQQYKTPEIIQVDTPQQERGIVHKPAPKAKLPEINLAAYKLLVVDDDMRNIYSLTSILDDYKPNIVIANNGLEAVEILAQQNDIDMVFMDIMMPVMDGYQAMDKIRNELNLKNLPIVAVTAKAMKGDGEKCKEAGASDYLPKPVAKDKLIACITHWLNLDKAIAV